MPKANGFFVRGHHYHLTHRCRNGDYLLRFARDRKAYRDLLRQYCKSYKVPYRIVDQTSFKQSFEQDFNNPAFIEFYSEFIQDAIEADLQREPAWSESLAVGSRKFAEEMSGEIKRGIRLEIHDSSHTSGRCILKEEGPLYS